MGVPAAAAGVNHRQAERHSKALPVGGWPDSTGLGDRVRRSLRAESRPTGVDAAAAGSFAEILAVVSDGRKTHFDRGSEPHVLLLAFARSVHPGSPDLRFSELAHLALPEGNGREVGSPGTGANVCGCDGDDGRDPPLAVPGKGRPVGSADGIAAIPGGIL